MKHRRDFIKTAALGTLGGATILAAREAKVKENSSQEINSIQLAIATICSDGFGDENFEPTFKIAPKAGFRNIEFNCWYNRNLTPKGLRSIAARCQAQNLTPISIQGQSFGKSDTKEIAHKLWCMEAASKLGCKRVKFTGSKRGSNGGLHDIINTLKEIAPAAEEMGVLICVENHVNNNLENIADYEELFSAIDSPSVGLCLDTGHFDGAGISIPDVIEKFHSRTNHVDLKDCKTFGEYKTVRFGEGITDLHGTIQALISHDYQGYLVIEQAPPISPDSLEQDLASAYQMFAKYISNDQ
ncbi:sugar phosphate isomerase/epimerase [Puniceicoccaceae bacterium K14]|nr:sugar phosphate isomerase/epimerase [Puniceicoccaceae bacterium K14]